MGDDHSLNKSRSARNAAKTIAQVSKVYWTMLGLLSLLILPFAVMIFDEPGSDKNPARITLFFSVVAFPVACFVSVCASLSADDTKNYRAAAYCAIAPLLCILVGIFAAVVATR